MIQPYYQWLIRDRSGRVRVRGIIPNGICTAAFNDLLNVYFRGASQDSTWFVGLIANTSYSAVGPGDTMSSHAGWSEYTAYSESTRAAWSPAAASGAIIANSTALSFTANASGTFQGFFLASDSTKSGTSGLLFSTAPLAAGQALFAGEVLSVTYKIPLVPNDVAITSS